MGVRRSLFRSAIAFIGIAPIFIQAQTAVTAASKFEVATIKRSAPGARGPTIYNPTRGRFAVDAITTKDFIAYAYDVREFQISGGPTWLGSEQYDIVAKPEGDASGEKILAMARSLLAERFDLTVHRESKEMPVFVLMPAKGGPKLQPSAGKGGPEVRGGRGRLVAKHVTMEMIAAQMAARVLDRPVLDRTAIAGEFDITLEWTPDGSSDVGPSIFTALQEQLGLKLETQKGFVDVLVVDHVEKPSAN
jgi:uncharacterized protein (TIGR03435 family)